MKTCKYKVIFALVACLTWQTFALAKGSKSWEKNVPESKEDLLSIQAKLQATLKKAKGAVVAIQSGGGSGSRMVSPSSGAALR